MTEPTTPPSEAHEARGRVSGRLVVTEIEAMLREAEADWPRLGRMQCGELADVATTATRAVTQLARELIALQARTDEQVATIRELLAEIDRLAARDVRHYTRYPRADTGPGPSLSPGQQEEDTR